jgi:DNA polymerase (family 10)
LLSIVASSAAVVAGLREIAALLALHGASRYKARAFERGARSLEASKVPVNRLIEEGTLRDLPGIGFALAAQIEALHATGRSELLDSLRAGLPRGVLELSQVAGIGLHALRTLHDDLGIDGIDDLRRALDDGRLRGAKGFGEARAAKIRAALEQYETKAPPVPLHIGRRLASALQTELGAIEGILEIHVAGPLRRFANTSAAVDLVVVSAAPEHALDLAAAMPRVSSVERRDARSCRLRLPDGTRIVVVACRPEELPTTWGHASAEATHWQALVERAVARGFDLTPEGLRVGDRAVPLRDEHELYERLGWPWAAPELREGSEPPSAATLIERRDVAGFVHCHTTWSDGKYGIEEMARAAQALGATYLTITDHSRTAHYAGGLDVDRLRRQWDEIAEIQERVSIRILRGTEADILADGALDWPDAILDGLDVVIASIHRRYGQGEDAMTDRVLRAMRHPVFKIWGHPLGRLVSSRPPIPLRIEAVLDAIAGSRAAIEINGDPHRLDLPPEHARAARARGIPFVLSVDAHSIADLDYLEYAVGMARRGGLRREDVLNTLPAADFTARVHP